MNFHFKSQYNIDDLLEIVRILRSDEGCPWDKEQTHKTIRQNFIEETYEAIEAIDYDNTELLEEELGDVLLQVVFHSQMESEIGNFNFDNVADGICKKLIVRHPHVFGETTVNDTNEVLENWEKIKQKTKNQNSQLDAINSIAKSLPALMRAYKIIKKAEKIYPELTDSSKIISDINEKANRLADSATNTEVENYGSVIGELLFSVVRLAVNYKVDAESALVDSCESFIKKI